MKVQTRAKDGTLTFFQDVKEAFDYARNHEEIWKISFEDVRLVRITLNKMDTWLYQPMDEIIENVKKVIAEKTE